MTRRLPRAGRRAFPSSAAPSTVCYFSSGKQREDVFKTVVSDCESERLLKTQDLLRVRSSAWEAGVLLNYEHSAF